MAAGVIKLSAPEAGAFWKIDVLFEDEQLLALNKPSGLLVAPDRYDPERPNLMKLLHRDIARGAEWAVRRGIGYLSNAHRLDFETSGVMLLAKTKPALAALSDQFGSEKPLKRYAAIVQGAPKESAFEVDKPLSHHPRMPQWMRVDPKNGKKSRTAFRLLEAYSGYALLECRPFTERTHQIRAHLRFARLPVAGDSLYGGSPLMLSSLKRTYRPKKDQPERPLIGRVALHAEELQVFHPATGERVILSAPRPQDFTVAVKYLRRFARLLEAARPGALDPDQESREGL